MDRFLTDEAEVWSQNAWDHVPPPDDQDEIIAASLAKQRIAPVAESEKPKYNEKPARHWCVQLNEALLSLSWSEFESRDTFYKNNSANFFRDRKWYG